jgi:hypothetical protein
MPELKRSEFRSLLDSVREPTLEQGIPPCTEILKEAIFACLRSHLPDVTELTDTHPTTLSDVSLQGGRVVINDMDDRTIQRQVTTQVASSPALQFTAYHQNSTIAGRLAREVDTIIKRKCCCVEMSGQWLHHVQRRQRLPVRFIGVVSLFSGGCVFEFFLQRRE